MDEYAEILIEGTKFMEILCKYKYMLRLLQYDEMTEDMIHLEYGSVLPPKTKEELIQQFVSELASSRSKDYNELLKLKAELLENEQEVLSTLKRVEWDYTYEGEGDCANVVSDTYRYEYSNGHEFYNKHRHVYE